MTTNHIDRIRLEFHLLLLRDTGVLLWGAAAAKYQQQQQQQQQDQQQQNQKGISNKAS